MSLSPSDSTLYAPLFVDPRVAEIFRDEAALLRMIRFEAALARVQGRLGVIPAGAAADIERYLSAMNVHALDLERLREHTARDGVPVAGLVQALRERLRGFDADAAHLHWGATTQDVLDTVLVLQLRDALAILREDLRACVGALSRLARRHRDLPAVGRTHGRQAAPVTFGLKAAGWAAPLLRHLRRLDEVEERVLVLQLGGAVGTLAPLGEDGPAVREALAAELGLGLTAMPWHVQRDGLAEVAGWLAGVAGSLAKMAQDVLLLSQEEVGEVRLGDDDGGGSSTLPQKSNPIAAEMIVSAARACAGQVASMHHALVQEHERGTHGWQLEWTALPQLVGYASSAVAKGAALARGLEVDEARVRANLEATNGLVLAEAVTFALAAHGPRHEAAALVRTAVREVRSEGRHLVDAVRDRSDAPLDWDALRDPARAVGSAGAFVDAVLQEADGLDARSDGREGGAHA